MKAAKKRPWPDAVTQNLSLKMVLLRLGRSQLT